MFNLSKTNIASRIVYKYCFPPITYIDWSRSRYKFHKIILSKNKKKVFNESCNFRKFLISLFSVYLALWKFKNQLEDKDVKFILY